MDSKKIKILHLEDVRADSKLIELTLKKADIDCDILVVETEEEYKKALYNFQPAVILSDHTLPLFDSMLALDILKSSGLKIPFILVTGTVSEEFAVEAIKKGADDYILKDRLNRLASSITNAMGKFALEKKRIAEEAKNKESEQEYRNLIDSLPVAVYTCDVNGFVSAYNPAAAKLWGREPEIGKDLWCGSFKILNKNFQKISPDSCSMPRTIKEQKQMEGEEVIIERPDGSFRHILTHPTPKFDREGRFSGAVNVLVDITDKKKLETLYESANKLVRLGNWEVDIKANKLFWSRMTREIHEVGPNFEPDLATAINFYKEGYSRETITKVVTEAMETGKPWDVELKIITAKKNERWVRAIGEVRTIDGICTHILGSFQDINEKKIAENTLRKSEANLKTIFNSSDVAFVLLDDASNILSYNTVANEWAKAAFGTPLSMNTSLITLVSKEKQEETKNSLKWVMAGNSIDNEADYLIVDGSVKSYRAQMTPVKDNAGIVMGVCISATDITERKRSNTKLQETSNALLKALTDVQKIMDASLDIICSIDEEGRFVSVSGAAEKIWGYGSNELQGLKYMDLVYEKDHEHTLIVAEEIMKGFPVSMFENRYVKKNGDLVPMLWSARWDEADKLMYCIAKDATEKKRLESSFMQEKQRFHDLFLQAPSSIAVLKGPNHEYEMANPLYLETIGKTNIIGKPAAEVSPELIEQGFIKILDNVYKTGKTFFANERLLRVDKKGNGELEDIYLNFIYQPYKEKDDKVTGIFFFAVDVTKQVLSLRKIEASEKRFQSLIENSTDMKTLAAPDGTLLYASPSVQKVLGFSQKELLSMPASEMIFPDDIPELMGKVQELLQHPGKSFNNLHRLRHKNGNWIWCEGTMTNMLHEPSLEALVSNFWDVSERKKAEEEREKMTSNIVQHAKKLEQFAFIVSHNLRAPVAHILGLANVLKNDLSEAERQKSQQFLFQAVNKIDEVLKDLNKIVQLKSEITEYKEKVNFNELVISIESSIQDVIKKENVQIIMEFEVCKTVSTIRSYMHSIFHNLILNSIKYKHKERPPVIIIKTNKIEGKTILSFKDNGSGIDLKENGDKIFGLYKRFHTHIEGKGMGLFMVKTQVEALGGNIEIKSQKGEGTEFIIELPND